MLGSDVIFVVAAVAVAAVATVAVSSAFPADSEVIIKARCKANCLNKFLKLADNNDGCASTANCNMCWDTCNILLKDYSITKAMCDLPIICHAGCKESCNFVENLANVAVSKVRWRFDEDPVVTTFPGRTEVLWDRPRPVKRSQRASARKKNLVYILYIRDQKLVDTTKWKVLTETPDREYNILPDELFVNTQYRLIAVSDGGAVADVNFQATDSFFQGYYPVEPANLVWERSKPPGLNISATIIDSNVSLSVRLQWLVPGPPNGSSSSPTDVSSGSYTGFQVRYFMDDCNVYRADGVPYCDLAADFYSKFIVGDCNKSLITTDLMTNILYNSKYTFTVKSTDTNCRYSGQTTLITPRCFDVSADYATCFRTESSTEQSDDVTGIDWRLNSSLPIYNPVTSQVDVNISWVAPFNHSVVTYRITWHMLSLEMMEIENKIVNGSSLMLHLFPNAEYRVKAVALFRAQYGTEYELFSEEIRVNTSVVPRRKPMAKNYTGTPVANKSLKQSSKSTSQLDGVIVVVTCILSVVAFIVIVFILYKKRHSFKDIIISKTTSVSKSNSYKSSPGSTSTTSTSIKTYYANELLFVPDEWEIDPDDIRFSTPLGQGAFGKVVTGYYNDRKVAVKVIRDSAPISYKEDLLAEINLMKGLGSHPNIVSLVGACSYSEPIALIMEYVPYGNLQCFLKKCRIESEQDGGHHSSLSYSMMDVHGSVEEGAITPQDMLSFARQVAMAMEYLADKKYVHRDLAARNVLLGYNKVVKVCDFGLSRDIFNDNQYKKLTSGKLPLKWMAIESLRDRVFTTQSDVWSFGILLWEIVTMGASPYPNVALADLYYVLCNNHRMEKPSNCSDEIYAIMRQCWADEPHDRPTFIDLRLYIEELLTRDCNYLELDNIDVPLSQSDNSSITCQDQFFGNGAISGSGEPSLSQLGLVDARDDTTTVDVCLYDKSIKKLLNNQLLGSQDRNFKMWVEDDMRSSQL